MRTAPSPTRRAVRLLGVGAAVLFGAVVLTNAVADDEKAPNKAQPDAPVAQPTNPNPPDAPRQDDRPDRPGRDRSDRDRPPGPGGPPGPGPGPGRERGDNDEDRGNWRNWRPPAPVDLNDEQIEKVMAFVRETRPEIAGGLDKLRKEDDKKFRESLRRLGPQVLFMIALKERDPEAYERMVKEQALREKVFHLANKALKAEGEELNAIRAELRAAVAEQVEMRRKYREMELAGLEKRIAEIRQEMSDDLANKQQIIDRKVDEVIEFAGRMRDRGGRDRGPDRDGERRRNRDDGPDNDKNDK